MENTFIVQKLKCSSKDKYELAEMYYTIVSSLNKMKLTEREIQLVAFTAISGNISYANYREDFCKKYNTSSPTINNMISKLKKLGILFKDNGKIKVVPVLVVNFEKELKLLISLDNEVTSI